MFRDNMFFLDCLTLKYGKIVCPEKSVTTNPRCVTYQGEEDIIYATMKA